MGKRREREKEREFQLRMREIEMQERANQLKQKIEYNFDVSKRIRLVPPFQEKEVDKYFLHFETVAENLIGQKALDLTFAKCFDILS